VNVIQTPEAMQANTDRESVDPQSTDETKARRKEFKVASAKGKRDNAIQGHMGVGSRTDFRHKRQLDCLQKVGRANWIRNQIGRASMVPTFCQETSPSCAIDQSRILYSNESN
jgi:hypothetical protein